MGRRSRKFSMRFGGNSGRASEKSWEAFYSNFREIFKKLMIGRKRMGKNNETFLGKILEEYENVG